MNLVLRGSTLQQHGQARSELTESFERTQMSNGGRALLVVLASSVVGAAYFSYLTAVPFPPAIARLVPPAWFAACVAGWAWAIRALRTGERKPLPIVALALNLPNTMVAAIFLLAAMMGD